jgi:hypothetical protein
VTLEHVESGSDVVRRWETHRKQCREDGATVNMFMGRMPHTHSTWARVHASEIRAYSRVQSHIASMER